MTLGERILKYRKKAGISQEELADRLNVTRQSISLWETDQTLPSLDNLITLADIFDISMDELCGRHIQAQRPDENIAVTQTITGEQKPQQTSDQVKERPACRIALIIMLVLSIASVLIALTICFFILQTTTFPKYLIVITRYMWICFLFLPIPVASIVLGIVFTKKKYKCKRNIIAGSIVCMALIVCGLFNPIYKNNISTWRDSEMFIDYVNDISPATLPKRGNAIFSVPKTNEYYGTIMSGMIRYYDKDDYLEGTKNIHMMASIDNTPLPKGFLSLQDKAIIRDFHEFYFYNVYTEEENVVTSHGGLYVFMATDGGYNIYVKILRI